MLLYKTSYKITETRVSSGFFYVLTCQISKKFVVCVVWRCILWYNQIHQIDGTIYSLATADMMSMDNSLLSLYKSGRIDQATALLYVTNPDMLKGKLL